MSRQSRSQILALIERHSLVPRKAYGQHFLADPNLIDKVVATAEVAEGDRVVEVGAGTGALTSALAAAGARVVAYEIDPRLRPILEEVLADVDVDLRFADVMELDLTAELTGSPWKLVANLPYNVGTPLLLEVLLGADKITSMTVMVQKEVADRLVASPGSADYGLPSVAVALTARVVERFAVPPQVFVPPPQVASSVLRLDRSGDPPARLDEAMELARIAFGQRRKMLRRSLAGRVPEEVLEAAGIDPSQRPEQVDPRQFVALAERMAAGA